MLIVSTQEETVFVDCTGTRCFLLAATRVSDYVTASTSGLGFLASHDGLGDQEVFLVRAFHNKRNTQSFQNIHSYVYLVYGRI
jgi:hypothetical protein